MGTQCKSKRRDSLRILHPNEKKIGAQTFAISVLLLFLLMGTLGTKALAAGETLNITELKSDSADQQKNESNNSRAHLIFLKGL